MCLFELTEGRNTTQLQLQLEREYIRELPLRQDLFITSFVLGVIGFPEKPVILIYLLTLMYYSFYDYTLIVPIFIIQLYINTSMLISFAVGNIFNMICVDC